MTPTGLGTGPVIVAVEVPISEPAVPEILAEVVTVIPVAAKTA